MIITKDRVVSIDYTLTDLSGQILDSSKETGPLSYLHGKGGLISGLEKALEGLDEGAALKVTVAAAEAYGPRDEGLVINVPMDRFKDSGEVKSGMQFEAETAEGRRLVTVTKVASGMVTVDANHPLAGLDLNFDVNVVAVRDASAEELAHGHLHDACGCGCGDDCDEGCDGGDCEDCEDDKDGCGAGCSCCG